MDFTPDEFYAAVKEKMDAPHDHDDDLEADLRYLVDEGFITIEEEDGEYAFYPAGEAECLDFE